MPLSTGLGLHMCVCGGVRLTLRGCWLLYLRVSRSLSLSMALSVGVGKGVPTAGSAMAVWATMLTHMHVRVVDNFAAISSQQGCNH